MPVQPSRTNRFLSATTEVASVIVPAEPSTLRRYLSLSGTTARTIAQWNAQIPSDDPAFLAYAERISDGLRKAGMPEE